MPEHETVPTAPHGGVAGGYPPMTPLRGAVPDWTLDEPLTPVSTPEAARAALRAEAETSVRHPASLPWGVVRAVVRVVFLGTWLWFLVTSAASVFSGDDPGLPAVPLFLVSIAVSLTDLLPWARLRADPTRESLPPTRGGRVRLTWAAARGKLDVTPPASWPAGSEAFALLSTVAATDGIDARWLLDRAALPAEVGARWLDSRTRLGWLDGGGTLLRGRVRRPWRITDDGRDRLRVERARLQSLAATERLRPDLPEPESSCAARGATGRARGIAGA